MGIGPVNIYSIGGILLVIGICNIPVVYMSVIHMLRRIPRDLEWASRACGFGLSYTLVHVDLVQVLPAIIAGGLLAFLSAIDNFSVCKYKSKIFKGQIIQRHFQAICF